MLLSVPASVKHNYAQQVSTFYTQLVEIGSKVHTQWGGHRIVWVRGLDKVAEVGNFSFSKKYLSQHILINV